MKQLSKGSALNHQALMDLVDFRIRRAILNHCTTPAGLAIGTTAATSIKAANTTTFVSGGVFVTPKTTFEVALTAVAHNIPASASSIQERKFLVVLAADGTPSVIAGDIATGAGNSLLPDLPAGVGTPIGYANVQVAAGAADFVAATSALNRTGITTTYKDLATLMEGFSVTQ